MFVEELHFLIHSSRGELFSINSFRRSLVTLFLVCWYLSMARDRLLARDEPSLCFIFVRTHAACFLSCERIGVLAWEVQNTGLSIWSQHCVVGPDSTYFFKMIPSNSFFSVHWLSQCDSYHFNRLRPVLLYCHWINSGSLVSMSLSWYWFGDWADLFDWYEFDI